MSKMTAKVFVDKAVDIAKNYKTLYVMGCFGAPLTGSNVSRYCNNHSYNKNATRTAMIKAAANQSPPVFGFDCVCLIKGILWGWDGDASRTYGGAGYAINGVPDIGADTMITKCTGVSTTGWDDMVIGEAVWMSGHIGIYIGDGLAVECSPKWENKVQITAVGNIGSKAGYNTRRWTKHGKLPYVDYTGASTGGGSQGTTQPSKPSEGTVGACVGDTVTFTGNKHYVSSNALNGSACKPGKAKVTAMAGNAKHPYHLIKVPGGGSTVYGWVDAVDIQVEGGITVGSKVKVNKGAKTYTGGGLASFVYTNTYTVIQVDGDRVVIGQNGVVTAAVNSKDLTLGGGSQGTTQPSKPSEGTVGACVGDTVTFTGNKHYVSSNALNGSACKPGKAKVTAMAGNAKHPYHLIKVPGGGSTVYGWVDAVDIQVEGGITVGSKVKVNKGAKTYTGGGLASFVYTNTYTVIQVDGDRVVIGQNGVVTAAVNSKDLTLVG